MSGIIGATGSKSGVIGIIGIGNNVSFSVRQNSNLTNKTGANADYTILFDTKISDPGNNYNTGTGLYTAPVSGMYYFAQCLIWIVVVVAIVTLMLLLRHLIGIFNVMIM